MVVIGVVIGVVIATAVTGTGIEIVTAPTETATDVIATVIENGTATETVTQEEGTISLASDIMKVMAMTTPAQREGIENFKLPLTPLLVREFLVGILESIALPFLFHYSIRVRSTHIQGSRTRTF
jgi:hypothetical protein